MSAEFPVTNGGLADAFLGAAETFAAIQETSSQLDEPAKVGDLIAMMLTMSGAIGAHLRNAEHTYPQTVCPMPGSVEMATAMQLLGYEHLRQHAPELLQREVVGIPRSDLCEVLGWLQGALECKAWEWSPDQHAYASQAYDRAMIFLNGRTPDDEVQAKDPVA